MKVQVDEWLSIVATATSVISLCVALFAFIWTFRQAQSHQRLQIVISVTQRLNQTYEDAVEFWAQASDDQHDELLAWEAHQETNLRSIASSLSAVVPSSKLSGVMPALARFQTEISGVSQNGPRLSGAPYTRTSATQQRVFLRFVEVKTAIESLL